CDCGRDGELDQHRHSLRVHSRLCRRDGLASQGSRSKETVQSAVWSLPAAGFGSAVMRAIDLLPAGRFLLALCRVAGARPVSVFFLWIYTQRSRAETRTPVADPGGPEVRSPLLLPRGGGTLRNPARRRAPLITFTH